MGYLAAGPSVQHRSLYLREKFIPCYDRWDGIYLDEFEVVRTGARGKKYEHIYTRKGYIRITAEGGQRFQSLILNKCLIVISHNIFSSCRTGRLRSGKPSTGPSDSFFSRFFTNARPILAGFLNRLLSRQLTSPYSSTLFITVLHEQQRSFQRSSVRDMTNIPTISKQKQRREMTQPKRCSNPPPPQHTTKVSKRFTGAMYIHTYIHIQASLSYIEFPGSSQRSI